jgi:hypothetical protein
MLMMGITVGLAFLCVLVCRVLAMACGCFGITNFRGWRGRILWRTLVDTCLYISSVSEATGNISSVR